jgi:hypothetical protein
MAADKSLLGLTVEISRKECNTMRTIGIVCLPFFCMGFGCIYSSIMVSEISNKYEKLLRMYGGPNAFLGVAQLVRRESAIFRKAVEAMDAMIVEPGLDLFELVKHGNVHFRALLCGANISIADIWSHANSAYRDAVWNEYLRLGGDAEVIMHGFIEYLLESVDPTSETACRYVDMLLHNDGLWAEVEAAGRRIRCPEPPPTLL